MMIFRKVVLIIIKELLLSMKQELYCLVGKTNMKKNGVKQTKIATKNLNSLVEQLLNELQ